MPPTYDLLIRGGTLIDPAQRISARRDVAFRDGRVAAVAETLAGRDAGEVIDARHVVRAGRRVAAAPAASDQV